MKRALAEPNDTIKFELREKDRQINKIFREAKFEDLMRRTEPKVNIHNVLLVHS